MEKEKDGVWRTIRGRRIFIGKGEDLATAMKNSGKFNDNGRLPKREDVMKGKKELARQVATEKWHKEYDPKKYKNEDYQDPKKRALMEKRREKVDKEFEKAHKEKNEFMDLYDKDRDDSELTWQDKVEKNTREARRMAEKINEQRDKGKYAYDRDKWADDYYGTFRDNEERNARIKEEPDDAPYEPIDAHKGYMDKFSKYNDNDTWTGKEYTNDEFMEHLTDANWHYERRMIEEAGLTNKQMTELKNQVKLSKWSADLDKEKTQKLIDKVKKEFPAKDKKKTIEDYKAKKQSNNKLEDYKKAREKYHKENDNLTEEQKTKKAMIQDKALNEWGATDKAREQIDKEWEEYKQRSIEANKPEGQKFMDMLKESGHDKPFGEEYPRAQGATKFEDLGLQVSDKKAFSDYLQDKYGTDDFRIINFDNKEEAKQIYNEYAEKRERDRVTQYFNDAEKYAFNNKDYSYGFSDKTLQKFDTNELQKYVKEQEKLYNKYKGAHAQSKMSDQRKKANKQDTLWNSGLETKYKAQYERALNEVSRREAERENTIKSYKEKKQSNNKQKQQDDDFINFLKKASNKKTKRTIKNW